jgi:hypothetical protein
VAVNTCNGVFFPGVPLVVRASKSSPAGDFVVNGRQEAFTQFTAMVNTTGAPTSYSVQVQVSLDNVHWATIGAAITADGAYPLTVANTYWLYIRANLTAVVGGTSPTIFMYWTASA